MDGITFPHKSVVEVQQDNGPQAKFIYTVQKVEVNPAMDEQHFRMPTTAPSK